jgi:hypothetical protein
VNLRQHIVFISLFFGFVLVSHISPAAGGVGKDKRSSAALAPCSDIDFKHAPEFDVAAGPVGITTADLDGDGVAEIATVFSSASLGLSILKNNGGAQFGPHQDIALPLTDPPSAIFAWDIDSDGRKDIIVTYAFTHKISIFRNLTQVPGNIILDAKVDYLVAGEGTKVTFGDVDGDGVVDIISANSSDTSSVSIFRNLSAGNGIILAPRVDFSVNNVPKSLSLADFDGDGRLDIVTGGNGSTRIITLLQNTSSGPGNINFAFAASFNTSNEDSSTMARDFDGDGKSDVAVTNFSADFVEVFRNTGSGAGNFNFAASKKFYTGRFLYDGASQDLDGDGKFDIATVNTSGNSISVLVNTSTPGTVDFALRSWDLGTGITPRALSINDLDLDGKLDIAVANHDGNNVSVLLNEGVVGGILDFKARKDYLLPMRTVGGVAVTDIAVADFDNDGNQDIAAAPDEVQNTFKLSVFRNDGSGHFPTRVDISTGVTEPIHLSTGDIDGDGRVDLIFANKLNVTFWLNTSTGPGNIGFAFTPTVLTASSSRLVSYIDLDGDGKKDLIMSVRQTDIVTLEKIVVFRNTSSGGVISFTQSASFTLFTTLSNLVYDDFDGDGKTDIAYQKVSDSDSEFITILRNDSSPGAISFVSENAVENGPGFDSMAAIDVDGDGKLDMVGTRQGSFYVIPNTTTSSQVTFGSRIVFPNLGIKLIGTGDMNGDHKGDIVAGSSFYGAFVSILKNTSSGVGNFNFAVDQGKFAYGASDSVSSGTLRGTRIVDLDHNGKLDIVNAADLSSMGSASVLLNNGCRGGNHTLYDFDGDGKTDVAIFRPSTGIWWYLRSIDGADRLYQFGQGSDKQVPADYTGDGRTDVAFFRPTTGEWFVERSEDDAFYSFTFGSPGDIPAAGDFDGDGKADVAVFRPSIGTWFISKSGGGISIQQFGTSGDVPAVADYDGDGKADIAIYRPSLGQWWIQRSTAGLLAFQFGTSTDKPVQGDYTGDGKTDVAIYRPSTGEWFVLTSETFGVYAFPFGTAGDIPAAGDYDGDGRTDAAVFRPSTGSWFILGSTSGVQVVPQFGSPEDKPVAASFIP